jgi:hypothetical protein
MSSDCVSFREVIEPMLPRKSSKRVQLVRRQSAVQSSIITSASLPQPSLPTELKGAELGKQEDIAVRQDILINFPDMFSQASKTTGTAHGNSDLERNAHGVDEICVAPPVQDDGSTDPRPQ